MKILFVCLGNICRSPLAQGLFEAHLKQKGKQSAFEVDSAGTSGYHAGAAPDPRTQKNALDHGLSLSHLRSRQVTYTDFSYFDLILCMDEENYRNLQSLSPSSEHHKIHKLLDYCNRPGNVPDPYEKGPEGFEAVYQLLEKAAEDLLIKLGKT